jgi:RNA polymerase sigma factor (TIGR02999 family)
MRQILVDHARGKGAEKRGGNRTRITLDEKISGGGALECDLLDLHNSLQNLAGIDERSAKVVELRTFAGMTSKEVAHILGVSKRTVDGDWKFARLWLSRDLSGETN